MFRKAGYFFATLFIAVGALSGYVAFSGADYRAPLGKVWFDLHLESLNLTQVVIQRHLKLPFIWDEWVVPMLQQPAWLVMAYLTAGLLILALLCLRIGRRKRRR